jgi:hypothetical protein
MRITHEEPGRRIEIEETESRLAPIVIILGLTVLVATPWRALWAMRMHGTALEMADLVPSALWAAGGLFIVLSSFGGHRLERLSADRLSGRLEWRRSHVLGLLRWSGALPLDAVQGLALSLASPPGRSASTLRMAFRHAPGSRERRFEVRLSGLDSVERVADFALHFGAAAGLPWHRVTLNEGGRFAVEMVGSSGPGFERLPSTAGSDAIAGAAAAAVASERLPPFDPAAFDGDARVTVWEPGRELRIDKAWGPWALLTPLLLAAPLGPLSYFLLPSLHTAPLLPRIVAIVMLTLVGLMLAVVGWAGFLSGQPRHVRIDWASRELRVETLRHKRVVPLPKVAGVELRHKSYKTPSTRSGMGRAVYWSEVRLRLHEAVDSSDELLVATRGFEDAAAARPREMALPLARELGAALHVEVIETGPPKQRRAYEALLPPDRQGR